MPARNSAVTAAAILILVLSLMELGPRGITVAVLVKTEVRADSEAAYQPGPARIGA
jgi:hypothetical protein